MRPSQSHTHTPSPGSLPPLLVNSSPLGPSRKPLEQTGDDSSVLQLILEKKEELAVADLGLQAQKKVSLSC